MSSLDESKCASMSPHDTPMAITTWQVRREENKGRLQRMRERITGGSTRALEAEGQVVAQANLPAVLVHMQTAAKEIKESMADEMNVTMAVVNVVYSPPFWIALEGFLRPVERAKWSSQLVRERWREPDESCTHFQHPPMSRY